MTEPTREELLNLVVQQAAIASEGGFSARNPNLGRMVRCLYCRKRRREREICCNPVQLVTVANDVPRAMFAKKRKNPRLTKNRPPLAEVHQILLDKESQPDYKEHEGISGIVEAEIMRGRRSRTKKKRLQQRLSRKINRR